SAALEAVTGNSPTVAARRAGFPGMPDGAGLGTASVTIGPVALTGTKDAASVPGSAVTGAIGTSARVIAARGDTTVRIVVRVRVVPIVIVRIVVRVRVVPIVI